MGDREINVLGGFNNANFREIKYRWNFSDYKGQSLQFCAVDGNLESKEISEEEFFN